MRRHKVYCWPWQEAYAGHSSSHQTYESRWHSHRGSNFGVRRPLRHLTHRLDLDDSQVRRLASVLNQLKTEREQASLDEKRSTAAIAELLSGGTPTLEECRATLASRLETAKNLNEETAKAIVAISDLLDDDQRIEFTNLLLTGGFAL
ncbi:MAG: hypothetical protein ABGY96_05940 [bacterium]|nr:hypothetical protein [Gammaproteobacteria bacterium]